MHRHYRFASLKNMDTDDLFNSFHPNRHYDDTKRKGCQFVNWIILTCLTWLVNSLYNWTLSLATICSWCDIYNWQPFQGGNTLLVLWSQGRGSCYWGWKREVLAGTAWSFKGLLVCHDNVKLVSLAGDSGSTRFVASWRRERVLLKLLYENWRRRVACK